MLYICTNYTVSPERGPHKVHTAHTRSGRDGKKLVGIEITVPSTKSLWCKPVVQSNHQIAGRAENEFGELSTYIDSE